jgi:hypothetical protein
LHELWGALGEEDSAQALSVVGHLVAADLRAVEFLAARLRPAEAPSERLRQSILDLGHDEFAVRQRATAELASYGSAAAAELRAALAQEASPEACHRLEQLLAAASSITITLPDELRARRAICVLERIGGSQARRVLSYLASGVPAARQTRFAAQALKRLDARKAVAEAGAGRGLTDKTPLRVESIRSFGTAAAAYQACFSPSGDLLATCSGDQKRGQVVLWNIASGDQVRVRLDLPSAASCVCFSPCGRLLAAGGGNGRAGLSRPGRAAADLFGGHLARRRLAGCGGA